MKDTDQEQYTKLRRKLVVHIHALHKDAQNQPSLACDSGELAAELKAVSKRHKLLLDEVKAEADRDIRNNPDEFGLAKVTESAVKSAIDLHPDVQRVVRESIDADLDADKATTLANAFEHRRSMIKNEIQLYLGEYWGDVEVKEHEMRKASGQLDDDREERITRKRRAKRTPEDKTNN
ncbi:hypothetical protein LCGC14_0235140 [marine sediment metagenome]|uniref:Uncharacterized protein n=1 Tax=marine sediment metagenome TaxID=412755 RepID=A0A0F9XD23_9ZZZZ